VFGVLETLFQVCHKTSMNSNPAGCHIGHNFKPSKWHGESWACLYKYCCHKEAPTC